MPQGVALPTAVLTMSVLQLLFSVALILTAALIGAGGLGGFFFYALLVRRLKLDHNDVWISLGSPSYIPAYTPGTSDYWYGALFDWIRRRDYLKIPDPDVVRLASTSRILFIALFTGLACIAALVALSLAVMLWGI